MLFRTLLWNKFTHWFLNLCPRSWRLYWSLRVVLLFYINSKPDLLTTSNQSSWNPLTTFLISLYKTPGTFFWCSAHIQVNNYMFFTNFNGHVIDQFIFYNEKLLQINSQWPELSLRETDNFFEWPYHRKLIHL